MHGVHGALTVQGRAIAIAGLVQGVGFRPFVWRIARDEGLAGAVWNDGAGVRIELWGTEAAIARALGRLRAELPPLARIDHLETTPLPGAPPSGFVIRESGQGARSAGVTPDAATCQDCLAEINDPADRRFGYPFTNCTNCGPRLSIVEAIPYDRANTSMRAFTMCPACAAEYGDPADRRYHAQPNSCPDCGPHIWLEDAQGRLNAHDPLTALVERLRLGQIAAIKGIGGFHLACDARNESALALLRQRKRRDAKPLALMASEAMLADFAVADAQAMALMRSPAAPIVVIPAIPGRLPDELAPGQDRIGVMLPYTPLHHLLLNAFGGPLVMTSANLSEEPQVIDNAVARERLSNIADIWLMHDRAIVNRVDDSVMVPAEDHPIILRRARGLAPAPIRLHASFGGAPPILALGGDIKSAFCMLQDGQAVLSHHLGDLDDSRTQADARHALSLYRQIYDFTPAIVAIDLHEGYHSARWGEALAEEAGAMLVRVQHHHAHVAACMAEHGLPIDAAPVSGWMLDGIGMGDDGTLWGGELLRADFSDYRRIDHLPPVAMPGGNAASREPWRNLIAHLRAAFGADWRAMLAGVDIVLPDRSSVDLVEQMIAGGINAPLASSTGRLFDAVAALLGYAPDRQSFEGEAAMRMEAAARAHADAAPYDGARIDDLNGLWRALLADRRSAVPSAICAARFHASLAAMLADRVRGEDTIFLSGGVMQNGLLASRLRSALQKRHCSALMPLQLPPNDGGIALGQAAIAAARALGPDA